MAGGLNLYAYAPNPVSWIDPLGLKCGELRNRRQALNKAKDLAGIPRSQQPNRQWTVGNDPRRRGQTNYKYSEDLGSHGRYYEYTDAYGRKKVVVEHTADPRAPALTHMQDNLNRALILEHTISKVIDIRRSMTL
ncbi:HNH/endonuclease VII fold putative polymorphic toxin [Escherichia coli]|nr:HNH/endonuclease VII fold putative polymorphic toxin [Escherichia coli]